MSETLLTFNEASKLIESLNLDQTEWRHWAKRTDGERLALGLVILQRHLKGKSMRTIEAELGIPLATCQRYKERALSSLQMPTVEEARREELERLEAIIVAIWPNVEAGDKDAIASYMKVSERKAKMLGWDKPIEISSTVVEITQQERELQDMLAQAERDQKMIEAQLSQEAS
jgi:hypothetical protein